MGENDEYQTPLDIGGSLLCVGSSCRKVNEAYRLCVEENTSENPVCSALLRKRNDCLRQCIAPRQFHNFYHWRKTDKKAEQYKNAELEMETSFRTFVDTIVNDKSLEMMQSYQRIMNNLTEGCRPQFTKVEECLRQNSRAECRAEIQASELCMIRGRIGYSDEWKGFSRCISEGKRSCEKEWRLVQRKIGECDTPLMESMNVDTRKWLPRLSVIRAGISVLLEYEAEQDLGKSEEQETKKEEK